MGYFIVFIKQLFDIGNSAGSLIMSAISLFKTFQRMSAPKVFATKFSHECNELFSWANDLIRIVLNAMKTIPFSNYELFTIYVFVLPITIIVFISSYITQVLFFIMILLFGGMLGFGVGLIFLSTKEYSQLLFVGPIFIVVMFIVIIISFCCKCVFSEEEKYGTRHFAFSVLATMGFFYILMIPIMKDRWKLLVIITVIISILIVILIFVCCLSQVCGGGYALENLNRKICGFLITCLSLFIIPSTECFAQNLDNYIKDKWPMIPSYILNSIIIPISIILAMIILRHPNISSKYKRGCFYSYMELIDNLKQIGYAFAAIYDIIWLCLVIEIIWGILVFAVRPYKNISDYSLTAGTSLILIISNSALIYSNDHKSQQFSFGVSLFFLSDCRIGRF